MTPGHTTPMGRPSLVQCMLGNTPPPKQVLGNDTKVNALKEKGIVKCWFLSLDFYSNDRVQKRKFYLKLISNSNGFDPPYDQKRLFC